MGIFDKLRDVNEMRKQAKHMELLLEKELVTGSSSGDGVKITIDGNQNVKSVEVRPDVAGDKSEVARHVRQALENLFSKHKKMLQSKFSNIIQ